MKSIEHEAEVYAVVVGPEDFAPGIKFLSGQDWGLQLGTMLRPTGHTIPPHCHNPRPNRVIAETHEFLFVIAGNMEVTLYDRDGYPFHTEEVKTGHGILQIKGGHGFRFAETSCVIEIKQGPYVAKELDKTLIAQPAEIGRRLCTPNPYAEVPQTIA